jgi:hypothetical protein
MFQVASFTPATYIGTACNRNVPTLGLECPGRETGLDPRKPSNVRIPMKAANDLTLWSIIERLQRRLERQGMTPASADRALSLALRQLAGARSN